MRSGKITGDDAVIRQLRYRRDRLEEEWNKMADAIRSNPNQMNIRGIWQADYLEGLLRVHTRFVALESVLMDAEREMESRKGQHGRRRVATGTRT